MFTFDITCQLISKLHMLSHKSIRIATIISHKTQIVFPRTCIFIFHIRDYLIHHLSRLLHSPDRKASDPQT